VLAFGHERQGRVVLALCNAGNLDAFEHWLRAGRTWVGGFDFPFGLPRELVEHLGWPTALGSRACALRRPHARQIRDTFAAFCDARPAGQQVRPPRRSTGRRLQPVDEVGQPAGRLHAACRRVPLAAGGGRRPARPACGRSGSRVALEAYPGLLARELIGRRSYKSDDKAKQTPERLIARKDLVTALEKGRRGWALRLKLSHAQRDALADDASGDSLDAVLCLCRPPGRAAGRAALRLAGRAGSAGRLDRHRLTAFWPLAQQVRTQRAINFIARSFSWCCVPCLLFCLLRCFWR
jgi:hypothetical protein